MQFAFILDPLESLKAYKDTSVCMMREAHARGHSVWTCQQHAIAWRSGGKPGDGVGAEFTRIELTGDDASWYRTLETQPRRLAGFDAVLMRKDPPFDLEYVTSTWLLEQAEREGARVFNRPDAIRDHNEKLAIAEFPDFVAPTLVTRDPQRLHAFIDEQRDVVVKRLDVMGGENIFRVRADDPNRNVIVEIMAANTARAAGRRCPRTAACGARPAAGRPGHDRRLAHRGQCHQPHLLSRNSGPDRVQRGRHVRRCARGRVQRSTRQARLKRCAARSES
jgi:glutathione synthase